MGRESQPKPEAVAAILTELLVAQGMLHILPSKESAGEYVSRTLSAMPGCASCAVCYCDPSSSEEYPKIESCSGCVVSNDGAAEDPCVDHLSSGREDVRSFRLETGTAFYGYLVLRVDSAEKLALFEPFLFNLANSIAVAAENRRQREQITEANNELTLHRDHLERLVEERSEALHESEKKNRFLVENAPYCIHQIDRRGRIMSMNPAGVTMMEATCEQDVVGLAYLEAVAESDKDRIAKLLKAALDGDASEFEFRASNDHLFASSFIPIFGEGGEVVRLMGLTQDITDRRQAEEKLSSTATLLANILDTTPDMIFAKDTELRTIVCNEVFAQAVGKTPAEMLGQTDIENGWSPELVRGNPEKGIRGFETDDREALSGEIVHNPDDPANVKGEVRIFDTHKLPLRDAEDQIIGVLGIARDVTEQRKAQKALRASELHLREAQRISQSGHWIWNPQNGDLYWSDELLRIFGEELAFKPSYESYIAALHEDDKQGVIQAIDDALANIRPYAVDVRIQAQSGEWKNVYVQGEVDFDSQGVPILMRGTVTDITKRKAAEAARRESEERFRIVARLTNDVIWEWDIVGGVHTWHGDIDTLLGYGPSEFPRTIHAWENILHPEDKERVLTNLDRHLKEHVKWHEQYRIIQKDGEIRYWDDWGETRRSEDGTPLVMTGAIVDITGRRQAEEELRSNAERFERWQASNFIGILQSNDAGDITEANDALLDMLGYTRQELRDGLLDWTKLTPPELAHLDQQAIKEAAELGYWKPFEKVYLHKDGRRVPILLGGSIFKKDPGEYIAFVVDLTASKQAEEAVRTAQDELLAHREREKELVEAELANVREELVRKARLATIGQVAASIAHEIRNPLGAVRNAAFFLKRHVQSDDPKFSEYLDIIDQEVAAADSVIHDMMEMARSKVPVKESTDLGQALQDVLERIHPADAITCEVTLESIPFLVHADPGQLRQVLTNILINAIQEMKDGGIITIGAMRTPDHDTITICDGGPGVAAEHREQLFEPLFTTKAKGTGLGLTICRQIIERHGGTIELIDQEGCGATFCVRLPRCVMPTAAESVNHSFQSETSASRDSG